MTEYTKADAHEIWNLVDLIRAAGEKALENAGWRIRSEMDGDRWWMRGERADNSTVEEFLVEVMRDGRTAGFEGDVPEIAALFGRAMMPLVGPYLESNSQH
jgi:hypothetical protein